MEPSGWINNTTEIVTIYFKSLFVVTTGLRHFANHRDRLLLMKCAWVPGSVNCFHPFCKPRGLREGIPCPGTHSSVSATFAIQECESGPAAGNNSTDCVCPGTWDSSSDQISGKPDFCRAEYLIALGKIKRTDYLFPPLANAEYSNSPSAFLCFTSSLYTKKVK